jgi:hypothetical protein
MDSGLIGPDPWYSGGTRRRCATGLIDRDFLRSFGAPHIRIDRNILQRIANNSSAIDLYIWLTETMLDIQLAKQVPWSTLAEIFMGSYVQVRHFQSALAQTLRRVEPLMPNVFVDQDVDGWTIHRLELGKKREHASADRRPITNG